MSSIARADARSAVLVATRGAPAGRTLRDWMLKLPPHKCVIQGFTLLLRYQQLSPSQRGTP